MYMIDPSKPYCLLMLKASMIINDVDLGTVTQSLAMEISVIVVKAGM
jgi:hypothetical protein